MSSLRGKELKAGRAMGFHQVCYPVDLFNIVDGKRLRGIVMRTY